MELAKTEYFLMAFINTFRSALSKNKSSITYPKSSIALIPLSPPLSGQDPCKHILPQPLLPYLTTLSMLASIPGSTLNLPC